jgi:hypothetical protein
MKNASANIIAKTRLKTIILVLIPFAIPLFISTMGIMIYLKKHDIHAGILGCISLILLVYFMFIKVKRSKTALNGLQQEVIIYDTSGKFWKNKIVVFLLGIVVALIFSAAIFVLT